MKTFGNKFRKERERLRYSIEDVAGVTKIGARMLKAIEDEHFDVLPGGIFNKGFIRAYAKHLGMNPEEAVTDYLACMQQKQIDALPASDPEPAASTRAAGKNKKRQPTSSSKTPAPQAFQSASEKEEREEEEELPDLQLPKAEHVRPPKRDFPLESGGRIPWKLLAAAAVAFSLAAILWIRHTHTIHSLSAKSADSIAVRATEPAPTPAPSTNPPTAYKAAYKEVAARKDSPAGNRPQPNPAQEKQLQKKASTENLTEETDPDSASATTPAAATTKDSAPLTLVIRATETSWVSITADGQPVAHETLIAPAHTTIHATREIAVRIGNAAGLTFLLNGKEIPTQGAESEVKTLVFNAAGLATP